MYENNKEAYLQEVTPAGDDFYLKIGKVYFSKEDFEILPA